MVKGLGKLSSKQAYELEEKLNEKKEGAQPKHTSKTNVAGRSGVLGKTVKTPKNKYSKKKSHKNTEIKEITAIALDNTGFDSSIEKLVDEYEKTRPVVPEYNEDTERQARFYGIDVAKLRSETKEVIIHINDELEKITLSEPIPRTPVQDELFRQFKESQKIRGNFATKCMSPHVVVL